MQLVLINQRCYGHVSFSAEGFNAYRDNFTPIISNSGEAYFIFETDNRPGNVEDHKLMVMAVRPHQTGVELKTIQLEEFLTYDVAFSFDNLNDKLIAVGLYSEKNLSKSNGYFFLRFSPSGSDGAILNMEPFSDEFLSNLLQKEIKNNKGLADVEVREVVLRRDGGVLLAVERSREYERRSAYTGRTYSSGTTGRFIVDYYHDDVFVVSIHPSGETHWRNIMYKRQYSQDDDAAFSSFFLLKTPKSLRFYLMMR